MFTKIDVPIEIKNTFSLCMDDEEFPKMKDLSNEVQKNEVQTFLGYRRKIFKSNLTNDRIDNRKITRTNYLNRRYKYSFHRHTYCGDEIYFDFFFLHQTDNLLHITKHIDRLHITASPSILNESLI